ncbi:MAG: right-handed parallel beta-helix repeat-containing protein [Proteobacteria bacterium]|nr:right-handed parallel beta-helix repeat-containing protein [Pseudomonadota bacterium]
MLLTLLVCTAPPGEPLDSVVEADADTNTDADADSDADTDSDSDTDTGTWTRPERPDTDTPSSSDSWRYGGGAGYPDFIDPDWPIVTRVETLSELEAAIASVASGDVIWVEGHADIDLSDTTQCIPGGVTLASDRGVDGAAGAILRGTLPEKVPVLSPCGDDVRITGLRIWGADRDECPDAYPDACTEEDRTGGANCRDCTPSSIGVQVKGFDGLEIDNNELAGWSYAATWYSDSLDGRVHHNHIHHNQRQGLGYGVVLTRGGDELVTVDVRSNRFDRNRHVIAGSGEPGQDYEAHENLVLESAIGHVFDMHGEDENTENGSEYAGGHIDIHDNTVLVDDQYAMVIRGRPEHGAWLYDNCLARSESSAAKQSYFTGNMWLDEAPDGSSAPNRYGADADDCEFVRFCTADGGAGPWDYLAIEDDELDDVAVGDFDGDGVDELFRTTGSSWEWLVGGAWSSRNTSSYTLSQLRFADVDGDGATDVITRSGDTWLVSLGGSGGWTTWNTETDDDLDDVAFADLDGDGADDAFKTEDGSWWWSSGASSAWAKRNTSSAALSGMVFGDFDGDGADDVLRTSGSSWMLSSGGSSSWSTHNTSGVDVSGLWVADVDGDGTDDLVRAAATDWFVSYGASSGWSELRIATRTDAAWGDFDGDGRDDALIDHCL